MLMIYSYQGTMIHNGCVKLFPAKGKFNAAPIIIRAVTFLVEEAWLKSPRAGWNDLTRFAQVNTALDIILPV